MQKSRMHVGKLCARRSLTFILCTAEPEKAKVGALRECMMCWYSNLQLGAPGTQQRPEEYYYASATCNSIKFTSLTIT
jgi:hypothetical protein